MRKLAIDLTYRPTGGALAQIKEINQTNSIASIPEKRMVNLPLVEVQDAYGMNFISTQNLFGDDI